MAVRWRLLLLMTGISLLSGFALQEYLKFGWRLTAKEAIACVQQSQAKLFDFPNASSSMSYRASFKENPHLTTTGSNSVLYLEVIRTIDNPLDTQAERDHRSTNVVQMSIELVARNNQIVNSASLTYDIKNLYLSYSVLNVSHPNGFYPSPQHVWPPSAGNIISGFVTGEITGNGKSFSGKLQFPLSKEHESEPSLADREITFSCTVPTAKVEEKTNCGRGIKYFCQKTPIAGLPWKEEKIWCHYSGNYCEFLMGLPLIALNRTSYWEEQNLGILRSPSAQ